MASYYAINITSTMFLMIFRKILLIKLLMNCHFGPVKLLTEEKERIQAEFLTFLGMVAQAKTVMGEKAYTPTELWYLLLTNENYYEHCKVFIDFAVRL